MRPCRWYVLVGLIGSVGLLGGCDMLGLWQNEEPTAIDCRPSEEVEGRVVFRKVDSSDAQNRAFLHSMNADGSDLTQLSKAGETYPCAADSSDRRCHTLNSQNPHWGPDGEKIAYMGGVYNHISGVDGYVAVMNADGSNKRALTPYHSGLNANANLRWSPNGERILYGSSFFSIVEIDGNVIDVGGSGEKWIYEITVDGDTLEVDHAEWASSSDLLHLFAQRDGPDSEENGRIYLFRISTREVVGEVTSIDAETALHPRYLRLSPDGKKLLYERRLTLYLSFPLGTPGEVLRKNGQRAEWSNDSCHFVYLKDLGAGESALQIGTLGREGAEDQLVSRSRWGADLYVPESGN